LPYPRDIAPVPSRLERLADELRKFYGLVPTPPADPFALFVWEVLSFKSTPQKRALAFAALKRHRALTPDSMSKLAQKKLEDSVKLAGPPFEQRLRALRTGVSAFQHSQLRNMRKEPLPVAQESLGVLPHMADGDVDRMLLFAGGHRVLPMDADTARVIRRLGYADAPDAELPRPRAPSLTRGAACARCVTIVPPRSSRDELASRADSRPATGVVWSVDVAAIRRVHTLRLRDPVESLDAEKAEHKRVSSRIHLPRAPRRRDLRRNQSALR
jgi:endonuclease III-like uncharacterized protein